MIQSTYRGFDMAVEEIDRIYAKPVQGEQSIAVQLDMKAWAINNGMWNNETEYRDIVKAHGESRGWTQDGVTGMEIIQ
jgi:hypothetical protein